MSEGEYVTLGFEESHDIDDITRVLQNSHGFNKFILWGRSMGAVAG